jgi:lysophospholipase L1-like esterase
LKIYGATLTPFGGHDFDSPEKEAARQAVNHWIRTSREYDAVIDFDAALRDPLLPARLHPDYDAGDALHPNAAGYEKMAAAIPLELFRIHGSR